MQKKISITIRHLVSEIQNSSPTLFFVQIFKVIRSHAVSQSGFPPVFAIVVYSVGGCESCMGTYCVCMYACMHV